MTGAWELELGRHGIGNMRGLVNARIFKIDLRLERQRKKICHWKMKEMVVQLDVSHW